MPRIAAAILDPDIAYARGQNNPMLDLQYGGQMGYNTDMTEWVSNQQHISKNLVCLLIEPPKGMLQLPSPEYWVGTLRALVELHALRITGLQATLTVETTETPFGGAGQMQEDPTDVKEARSQISFTWNEKYGRSVQRFLNGWIRNLLMDPHSKFANINTFEGTPVTDMLADMYSATMLFFEPDPTHTKVVQSWLVSGMYPKSSGEITGQRDITAAGEKKDHDIEFAGIAQYGPGIDAFAQQMLSQISIVGANPMNRGAWVDGIDADVLAAQKSYSSNVSDLAASEIRV